MLWLQLLLPILDNDIRTANSTFISCDMDGIEVCVDVDTHEGRDTASSSQCLEPLCEPLRIPCQCEWRAINMDDVTPFPVHH